MVQAAFHLILKPDKAQRYIELHSPVPMEIYEQLNFAGISNFSIFRDDNHIFGILEYQSEEQLEMFLRNDASPSWTREIVSICDYRELDSHLPLLKRLTRVFRFEG